ncbi:MAG: M48 family metallopeptidase [Bryobacteraceae bacterium]
MLSPRGLVSVIVAIGAFAQMRPLSRDSEIRIGHLLAAKFRKTRAVASGPSHRNIEAYLQTVCARVAAHAKRQLPYRFRFDPDPDFKSAFALPGGEIFLGGGMWALLDSEDQLAAVLGHEIAHVDLNHCRDRLLGADGSKEIEPELFFATYGPDRELAADREGVKLAASAGYSPRSALRLLESFLARADRSPDSAPDLASDSAATLERRIDRIREAIETDNLSVPVSEKPLRRRFRD